LRILGLSGLAHNPAAALLGEEAIEAAVEELGWVYSQVTDLLGFTPHRDEHETH
jgi:predicted NodU family carbamoyl transferase